VKDFELADRVEKVAASLTREDAIAIRNDLHIVQTAKIASLSELVAALSDSSADLDLRLTACDLLGRLTERSASAVLAQVFESTEDQRLVWETVKALVRTEAKEAAPVLERALIDGDRMKQSAAAWALGGLGLSRSVQTLRTVATNPEADPDVRAHAVEALGMMEAVQAVPDLIALLSDASAEIRYWAAYSLGEIGDPVSIPALERIASTDSGSLSHGRSVREEARDALAAISIRQKKQSLSPDS
jgi:HEAT repeat protein